MATGLPESSRMSVDQSDEEEDLERHLINYLQTVLKYQIEPMNFMNLRKLVKEAPSQLKIYNYIQEKYPGQEFLTFLQKHDPKYFIVNPDRTVQVPEASYCPQPKDRQQNNVSYDEVDGDDNEEYISDQESDESDRMRDSDSETSK